jgi:hypothetical protein
MLVENKARARKMFWYSLFLFIAAHMVRIFAKPTQSMESDLFASVSAGFLSLPLGLFIPIRQLMDFTANDQMIGDPLIPVFSIVLSFIAAFSLIYGARIYAQGKGYGGVVGYLGLFGFAGIVILLFLPDKMKMVPLR